jgi:eukaryotic-like serine/threonine-protein kinase
LQGLLYDAELALGPYHQLPVELRRALNRQQQFHSK